MCNEYVIPLKGKIAVSIEQLEVYRATATSTSHRSAIDRKLRDLRAQKEKRLSFDGLQKN